MVQPRMRNKACNLHQSEIEFGVIGVSGTMPGATVSGDRHAVSKRKIEETSSLPVFRRCCRRPQVVLVLSEE
jgi:hypothetical protein